jgi:hypothetical protein
MVAKHRGSIPEMSAWKIDLRGPSVSWKPESAGQTNGLHSGRGPTETPDWPHASAASNGRTVDFSAGNFGSH